MRYHWHVSQVFNEVDALSITSAEVRCYHSMSVCLCPLHACACPRVKNRHVYIIFDCRWKKALPNRCVCLPTGKNKKMKLRVGQYVEILSHKGDWFKGRTKGNIVGIFPKYCVNLVKHEKRHHRAPPHTPKYVVALHSFEGHKAKELAFKKGTV